MRKMVKIVHGANRETEMSRANKPVMYLDFDGVLNAFPNTGIVNYSDVGHVELVPDPDGYRVRTCIRRKGRSRWIRRRS